PSQVRYQAAPRSEDAPYRGRFRSPQTLKRSLNNKFASALQNSVQTRLRRLQVGQNSAQTCGLERRGGDRSDGFTLHVGVDLQRRGRIAIGGQTGQPLLLVQTLDAANGQPLVVQQATHRLQYGDVLRPIETTAARALHWD